MTRAIRIKKLAKNTAQQVLREDQLDSAEYSSLQTQSNIETGVEKNEEKARDIRVDHMTSVDLVLLTFYRNTISKLP